MRIDSSREVLVVIKAMAVMPGISAHQEPERNGVDRAWMINPACPG